MICMLMFIVKEFFFVDVGVFFDNLILVDIYILNEVNKKGNYFLLYFLCFVKVYLIENY